MRLHARRRLLGAVALSFLVLNSACEPQAPANPYAQQEHTVLHLLETDMTRWVAQHDPERAFQGYNLFLFGRRIPTLVDMNGERVHSWPAVRASGSAKLDHQGRLTVISAEGGIRRYAWDGEHLDTWSEPSMELAFHHDFTWLPDDRLLAIANSGDGITDELQELDGRGRVRWRWKVADRLGTDLPSADLDAWHTTHVNAVQVLPENPLFDEGDPCFRPGNLLVSARNLDTIFVVDRASDAVCWQHSGQLDRQHTPRMVPRGAPMAGSIVVLDNGLRSKRAYRQSRVVVLDPRDHSERWSYDRPDFFSSVGGAVQPLPNGNTLVLSTQGGRAFEIDAKGDRVWEWRPQSLPTVLQRLAPDHCPQLAAMPAREPQAKVLREDETYFDRDLFEFGAGMEMRVAQVDDRPLNLLVEQRACRVLRLPPSPNLSLRWGLDRHDGAAPGASSNFRATIRPVDGGEPHTLMDRRLGLDEPEQIQQGQHPLHQWQGQRVELCLEAQDVGDCGPAPCGFWVEPHLVSDDPLFALHDDFPALDAAEAQRRTEQLKALGYVL